MKIVRHRILFQWISAAGMRPLSLKCDLLVLPTVHHILVLTRKIETVCVNILPSSWIWSLFVRFIGGIRRTLLWSTKWINVLPCHFCTINNMGSWRNMLAGAGGVQIKGRYAENSTRPFHELYAQNFDIINHLFSINIHVHLYRNRWKSWS